MARFEFPFPDAGVACTAGQDNFPIVMAAPSGTPMDIEEFEISTRSTNAQDLPMLVRVVEYETDGSTGTNNDARPIDRAFTATPPQGKHTEAGTGAQIPGNSGTVEELWRGEVAPQYARTINLIDIRTALGRRCTPGKFLAVVVKPNTVNQTVFITPRVSI